MQGSLAARILVEEARNLAAEAHILALPAPRIRLLVEGRRHHKPAAEGREQELPRPWGTDCMAVVPARVGKARVAPAWAGVRQRKGLVP